jgi:hypothetical protein
MYNWLGIKRKQINDWIIGPQSQSAQGRRQVLLLFVITIFKVTKRPMHIWNLWELKRKRKKLHGKIENVAGYA